MRKLAKQKSAGNDQASKRPEKLFASGVAVSVGKRTQFKPGQAGSPAGEPKGAISLSARIQRMLNDEDFEIYLPNSRDGLREFKGAPAEAIIRTAIIKAIQGDMKCADWLARYGYGTKAELFGEDGSPIKAVVEFVGGSSGRSQVYGLIAIQGVVGV
jgi:hypothetical protein